MAESVTVTQADREASRIWLDDICNKPLANQQERGMLADAFARHRTAAEAASAARIAELVEALETVARYDVGLQNLIDDGKDTPEAIADYYASMIAWRRQVAQEALARAKANPDAGEG